jgi:hypothetical protein
MEEKRSLESYTFVILALRPDHASKLKHDRASALSRKLSHIFYYYTRPSACPTFDDVGGRAAIGELLMSGLIVEQRVSGRRRLPAKILSCHIPGIRPICIRTAHCLSRPVVRSFCMQHHVTWCRPLAAIDNTDWSRSQRQASVARRPRALVPRNRRAGASGEGHRPPTRTPPLRAVRASHRTAA